MNEHNVECSIAIQVLPKVTDAQVIPIVDKVIDHIKSTGFHYMVGPFETTVEGTFEEMMTLIKACQLICIQEGAPQVASYIKIYYNPTAGVYGIDYKTKKHQR